MKVSHDLRDHVIVLNTVKTTFNLNIESTGKPHHIVENAGRALMKKKCCCLDQRKLIQSKTRIFMTFTCVNKSANRSCFKAYS